MAFTIISTITAAAEPQPSSGDPGKQAIDICMSAWNSAHDEQAENKKSTDWECQKAGNKAYLKAVPALSGYKNICDFVACINYASMTGIIIHTDAAHYLANARIALSTIYHNPNHIRERNRGKSEKNKRNKKKIRMFRLLFAT
jgi:hypothetical protein